jgi:hypothetical protein
MFIEHCTADEAALLADFVNRKSIKRLFGFKILCLSNEATLSLLNVNFKAMYYLSLNAIKILNVKF